MKKFLKKIEKVLDFCDYGVILIGVTSKDVAQSLTEDGKMQIFTSFNPTYVSSNEYVKVSFVIQPDDTKQEYDIFSVTLNKSTKHVETQRKVNLDVKKMKLAVYGRSPGSLYGLEDAVKDSVNYDDYECCSHYFFYAMNRFFQLQTRNYSRDAIRDVRAKVETARNAFQGEKPVEVENTESVSVEKWNTVDISAYDKNDLVEIVNAISENHGEETVYNGKAYRFYGVEGKSVLQVKEADAAPVSEQKTEYAVKVRKFVQMAKIVNAANFANIVNGNFYPVADKKQFNGKEYLILNVDGNHVNIRADRAKIVNVYTEPPF